MYRLRRRGGTVYGATAPLEMVHPLLVSHLYCLGGEQDGRPSDTVNQNGLVSRELGEADSCRLERDGQFPGMDEAATSPYQYYLCHGHVLHTYVEVVLRKLDRFHLTIGNWPTCVGHREPRLCFLRTSYGGVPICH